MSGSQLTAAHSAGYVAAWPYKTGSGYTNTNVPTMPVKIVVGCTNPANFALTSPANSSSQTAGTTSATLQWQTSSAATSYDVYFGTSSSPPLVGNQSGTSRSVTVSDGQTYYWKVVAKNSCGSTASSSNVWSFTVANPQTQGAGTIFLTGGTLAGQSLSASNWQVTVQPGAAISGTVQGQTTNTMGSNAVAPFGYTWTWGNRQSSIVTVNSWINTGATSFSVPISLTAPSSPGTYYILFGFNGEYDMTQVLSCTNWASGDPVWNDGNDYFDMSGSQLTAAHSAGYVAAWPYKTGSGYTNTNVPTMPVKIVVAGNQFAYSYWLPVASHAAGANNSQWQTDLGLLNAGGTSANGEIRFYGSGGVLSAPTTVPAGVQWIFSDVVSQVSGSGNGAVEVRSDQPLDVTSRTYNLVASGANCFPNGTQGQDYPAYTAQQGLSSGQSARLPQLTESAYYRTNIGLTNAGTETASVTVELHDGSGVVLTSYTVSLALGENKQENRPFAMKAGQANMSRGWAKVTVNSGSGVIAYASIVDNITNDPTTVVMIR